MSDDLKSPLELVDHAWDVVKRWDAEERRIFADWVSGYDPGAVMRFELYRRQLPARDRIREAR